ncbi:integrase, catalytic region, zinc finger, CCHC-type containing protein [Tanacetum coccineum]|uniref:Integrase, catalytic region, zinc finger, CCHC-type containing protein n=1 Tax=Tanacetum coccineum TaxID=301880 RepID=A0ABQ5HYM8_9ASTR
MPSPATVEKLLSNVGVGRFNLRRISLTGFPARSVGSSNADALDLLYLLILITGTSQSRQHVSTSQQISQYALIISMAAGLEGSSTMLGQGRYSHGDHVFYAEGRPAVPNITSVENNIEHDFQLRIKETLSSLKWKQFLAFKPGESLNVQDVNSQSVLGIWEVYFSRWRIHGVVLLTICDDCQASVKDRTVYIHQMFDILKQFQLEVNDIRAERIAKSANPLALIAAAQPYSDNYYQAPKPQRSNANNHLHKTNDPEQAQRDKEMQKNLALLAKYFKKLYKPTNNNLQTSSNSWNKTEDTTPRYNNDNQSRQFGNQRIMTDAGARETVGSQVVQKTGIQCFNCKGYGHYAKECRKQKWVKDYAYHKEKITMMCKQAEQGVCNDPLRKGGRNVIIMVSYQSIIKA